MKTDLTIMNEVATARDFYLDGLSGEQLEFVHHCMSIARQEELNHVKESLVPEEGHDGFTKILFEKELKNCSFVPNQLDIHPDDFFQFCEMERLIGNPDPRRELHFGQNHFEGLKLNCDRDVKPGHWKLTQTE